MLNRGGNFEMSMSTKVYSNHFAAEYCSDICPIPALLLKGYEDEPVMKRKVPIDRTNVVSPPMKKRIYHHNGFGNTPSEKLEIRTSYINEHGYESGTTPCVSGCARSEPYIKCSHCCSKDKKIAELLLIIDKQKHSTSQLQKKTRKGKKKTSF